ncbi:putative metallopeptidase [Phyllobacterium ifriqiyense]|uniref:putative metallopeptidase n=1 Tax=Phyllobacterium ifriqiyense TaxID=314238 RepID=UPI003F497FD6
MFTLRGHDIEEFVGAVRRYGAETTQVKALVDAANAGPEIANVHIAQACGTCQLRAA